MEQLHGMTRYDVGVTVIAFIAFAFTVMESSCTVVLQRMLNVESLGDVWRVLAGGTMVRSFYAAKLFTNLDLPQQSCSK